MLTLVNGLDNRNSWGAYKCSIMWNITLWNCFNLFYNIFHQALSPKMFPFILVSFCSIDMLINLYSREWTRSLKNIKFFLTFFLWNVSSVLSRTITNINLLFWMWKSLCYIIYVRNLLLMT